MQIADRSPSAVHPAAKVQPQRSAIPAHRPRVSSGAVARQTGWGLSAQPGPVCICFGAVTHMHCLTAAGVHSISALSLPLSQQPGHGGPGILQVGGVGLLHTHPGAQCMRLPIGVSSCPCIESALGHRQAGDLSGRLLYCCMCPPSNGVWLTPAGANVADALRRSLCRPCMQAGAANCQRGPCCVLV